MLIAWVLVVPFSIILIVLDIYIHDINYITLETSADKFSTSIPISIIDYSQTQITNVCYILILCIHISSSTVSFHLPCVTLPQEYYHLPLFHLVYLVCLYLNNIHLLWPTFLCFIYLKNIRLFSSTSKVIKTISSTKWKHYIFDSSQIWKFKPFAYLAIFWSLSS